MTITVQLQSPITAAPVRRRYLAGNGHAQPRASALPSTPKTQIARRDITLPPAPGATDTTVTALAQQLAQAHGAFRARRNQRHYLLGGLGEGARDPSQVPTKVVEGEKPQHPFP